MLTLTLEPAIERRITECARDHGISATELLRELIQAGLDDLDDIRMAEARLANPRPPVTSEEVRKALGLDD